MDVGTGGSNAALAGVEKQAHGGLVDGFVEVGVGGDDVRGFAAELQGHAFEVVGVAAFHDLQADAGGAGEGDFIDVFVGCQVTADLRMP